MTESCFSKIKLKRRKEKRSVCKWWQCDSHSEHLEIKFNYARNSPLQKNSRKNDKRREELGLLYSRQQS